MWFDSWPDVVRVVLVGTASYAALVVVLRASGKRTLAKLNAFDLVVTVAIGSTLATAFLSSDVSWVEGVAALSLLALLQFVVATVTARYPRVRAVVTAEPTLVLRDGILLEHALTQQRLTASEVRQSIRASGHGDVKEVAAVVLETDGTLSVIASSRAGDRSALLDVRS
jgi:uncharacterized membrane protein YcaP (DUF421 family)